MIEVNIEKYEGPMDLLLKLIEKNKINIYDIPIKEITEQYIKQIEKISTDVYKRQISKDIIYHLEGQ